MIEITKGMAQKLYNEGKEIMIIPDRIRKNSPLASWLVKPADESVDFDKLCNIIHYYNCTPKTGMKLVFYAKEV